MFSKFSALFDNTNYVLMSSELTYRIQISSGCFFLISIFVFLYCFSPFMYPSFCVLFLFTTTTLALGLKPCSRLELPWKLNLRIRHHFRPMSSKTPKHKPSIILFVWVLISRGFQQEAMSEDRCTLLSKT